MIQALGVSKTFKSKKGPICALDSVSLQIEPGTIFGLLGPNGAGKTTLLRIFSTLMAADAGTVSIAGFDVKTRSVDVRTSIGFLTGEMRLTGSLTARELLGVFGALNRMDRAALARRIDELADFFGTTEYLDRQIQKLSTGTKQKVLVSLSVLHDPAVILFDEPMNGLDIFAARAVVNFMRDQKKKGKTVVFSTHALSDVEKMSDTVGILIKGKLRAAGRLDEVVRAQGSSSLEEAFFSYAGIEDDE